MTDNTTQPGVRINRALWEQFRKDVESRKGAIRGHLKQELENAIREYINASEGGDTHDRLTRIESDIQDMATTLSEMQSKEKNSDVGSTVEKRVDKIEDKIREQTGRSPVVGEDVVEMAIKRIAGHTEPTIRRYKNILRDREALFPHPKVSHKFVRDKAEWVKMTQQMRENEVISQPRYQELVEGLGVDEFTEVYKQTQDTPERGVQ